MNDYLKQRILDGVTPSEYTGTDMESSKTTPGTIFVAISGKKQVGKDTATKIMMGMLASKGKRIATTAFAEPLKEMCINILGLKRELVYGTNDDKNTLCHIRWEGFPTEIRMKYGRFSPKEGFMTVREVLQVMGTDIFRAIYNNVWADAPFNRDWSNYDVVFLTDCRFPNEKKVTEEHGGVIIRLERDTGFVDNHPSETALDGDKFDPRFTYRNNGTLEELASFLENVLKEIHA